MHWCRMRTHGLGRSVTPACSCDKSPANTSKMYTSLFVRTYSMQHAFVSVYVIMYSFCTHMKSSQSSLNTQMTILPSVMYSH